MKQSITLIIFSLFTIFSFGQRKNLIIPINEGGDTSYWYKWIQRFPPQVGFADLRVVTDTIRFRISNISTAVEVWTSDYIKFDGSVSAFIECSDSNSIKRFTTLSKPLGNIIAKEVYEILRVNQVFDIPTQDKIEGWKDGLDGIKILIEYSTPSIYSFKEYWTPSFFREIKEARIIDSVQRQVWKAVNKVKIGSDSIAPECNYIYSGVKGI